MRLKRIKEESKPAEKRDKKRSVACFNFQTFKFQIRFRDCLLLLTSTMSSVDVAAVDRLWNSLNEGGIPGHLAPDLLASAASRPRKPKPWPRFAIEDIGRPFDIDAVSADDTEEETCCGKAHQRDENSNTDCERRDAGDACADLFGRPDVGTASVGLREGDSDDEKEDIKDIVPPRTADWNNSRELSAATTWPVASSP